MLVGSQVCHARNPQAFAQASAAEQMVQREAAELSRMQQQQVRGQGTGWVGEGGCGWVRLWCTREEAGG